MAEPFVGRSSEAGPRLLTDTSQCPSHVSSPIASLVASVTLRNCSFIDGVKLHSFIHSSIQVVTPLFHGFALKFSNGELALRETSTGVAFMSDEVVFFSLFLQEKRPDDIKNTFSVS